MTNNKPNDIIIAQMRLEHAQGVYDAVRDAYGVPLTEECDLCINPQDVAEQLERFPEGQFVALDGDKVVGMASTMRIIRPPDHTPRRWLTEIGSKGIKNHIPDGPWLYGVEMSVRRDYRKRGIGTALYEARFDLVRRLNLQGWYAGGMLMGYHAYRDKMTIQEYGEKVISGEIRDPTVSMQIHRGFEPWDVIENYLPEGRAGNAAILIVWYNSDYVEE